MVECNRVDIELRNIHYVLRPTLCGTRKYYLGLTTLFHIEDD